MLTAISRDIKFRTHFGYAKIEKKIFKYISKSSKLWFNLQEIAMLVALWNSKKGIKSKNDNSIRNICLKSSRPRSVYRIARGARINSKILFESGQYTGFRKIRL